MAARFLSGSATRYAVGAALSLLITVVLFLIMFSLIATRDLGLDQRPMVRVADVMLGATEIDVRTRAQMPDKPQEPESPPPPPNLPQQSAFNVDTSISVSFAPVANLQISAGSINVSDGEYLPIVKVAPIYPRRAQTRGVQGYCIVEYTVTTAGATRDAKAIDCKPKGYFDRASVKAAEKFKYKPRVVDGAPIEVSGVRNKFTFTLE